LLQICNPGYSQTQEVFVALYNESTNINEIKLLNEFNHFSSFLTTNEDGRSGNIMSGYASLMYFQIKYGFHGVMQKWQLDRIYTMFKKETLRILPTNILAPSFLDIRWEGVGRMNESSGNIFMPDHEFMENIDDYRTNRFLHIGQYPHFLWLFKEYLPELKKQFIFHDRLIEHVSNFKKQIQENIKENVVFVGVHCRRTDYANHLKVISGSTLVDHHFYDKAFEIYRKRYNKGGYKVVFIAVSDDPQWIKENMGKHEDVRFGVDYSSENVHKDDFVGFDLCILASSDHSIHTYGTFGLWGSLLAGGDVIVSKGRNENGLTEEDNIYKWSAMPGWLYIDTLNPEKISVLKLDNKTREFVETDTY